ncbi:MAG: MFS transporter [Promethearchaeota archaeon]
MDDPNSTISPRELHGKRLLGYTFGMFGIMLTSIMINTYSWQFYVYTINLDAGLTAVGYTLSLIVSALGGIFFGVIIDNKKPGKFGKRRPFLLYGLIIWFFSVILVWIPPLCPESITPVIYWPTALWFWITSVLRAISGVMIMIASGSMLPEQSQTTKNREKIATVQGILQIISSILALAIPLILQSLLPEPKNAQYWMESGKFLVFWMPIIGNILAVIGAILILYMFFSVDESFHKYDLNEQMEKKSIKHVFKQTFTPIKDKEFRKYMGVSLFSSFSGRMVGMAVIPFLTYVMGQNLLKYQASSMFIMYIIVSISCKFGWLLIWKVLLNRVKKGDIIGTYKWCRFIMVVTSFLEFFFLFVDEFSYEFRIFLFVISFGTVLGSMYAGNIFAIPIMAKLIDLKAEKMAVNDKNKHLIMVSNISGSYNGLSMVSMNLGSAIMSTILGFILSGDNATDPQTLTLVFAGISVFYLISWIFLYSMKVKVNKFS